MIVGSLLLILVAVVLLVIGLTGGSSLLLVGSIAASLLAAVALVVGARQDTAARAEEFADDDFEAEPLGGDETVHLSRVYAAAGRQGQRPGGYDPAGSVGLADPRVAPTEGYDDSHAEGPVVPSQAQHGGAPPPGRAEPPAAPPPAAPAHVPEPRQEQAAATAPPEVEEFDDEDPVDEPPPQVLAPADAARVARLSAEVLVIDGRPRYHLAGCVHLLGRESEPLPVSEAAELEFTPCSLCEPGTTLLADGPRA